MSTCHESADLVRAVGSSPAQYQPLSLASAHQLMGPASLLVKQTFHWSVMDHESIHGCESIDCG